MIQMGVSKNNGIPKSSIFIEFSIIFTIHFVGIYPYFWISTQMISSYWISPISLVFPLAISTQDPSPKPGRCKLLWDGRLRSCPECGATLAEEVLKVGTETARKQLEKWHPIFFFGVVRCHQDFFFFMAKIGKEWSSWTAIYIVFFHHIIIYVYYHPSLSEIILGWPKCFHEIPGYRKLSSGGGTTWT